MLCRPVIYPYTISDRSTAQVRVHATFRLWLLLIIGFHAVLSTTSALQHSAAIDEGGHVLSGLLYWTTGRFTTYLVNPPLGKLWISFPGLSLFPIIPVDVNAEFAHDWQAVHDEFVRLNPRKYLQLIILARLAIVPLSAFGIALVAYWAKRLYGETAGLLSATLWATNPMFLGWSAIATLDVLAATGMLAATYALWRCTLERSWSATISAGLVVGLAQLIKFSLLILYPAAIILFLLQRSTESWRLIALRVLAIFGISIAVINSGYGFPLVGSNLGGLPLKSDLLTALQRTAEWGRLPLPDAYVVGIDEQKSHSDAGYPTYFRGREYQHGFWHYYLYCALIKEPLPFLVCLALSSWSFVRRKGTFLISREGVLLAPSLLLVAALSWESGLHQHYRYIIPAMPTLFIFAGALGKMPHCPSSRSMFAVLIAWSYLTALASHPHHISYFNPLVGGASNGLRHLADSNVDCGQDLLFLRDWLEDIGSDRPIALAYTGPVSPDLYGISHCSPARQLGLADDCLQCQAVTEVIVISANLLVGRTSYSPISERMERLPAAAVSELAKVRPLARIGGSLLAYHVRPSPLTIRHRKELRPPIPSAGTLGPFLTAEPDAATGDGPVEMP